MQQAKKEALRDGLKFHKIDETTNYYRLRQFPPSKCKTGTYKTERAKKGKLLVKCDKK